MAFTEQFFESADGLSLYYREYGGGNGGVPVLCMPGISRNSRDFEDIAEHLSSQYRVIAVDFRGRGHSEYDPNWQNYHPQTYADDMLRLLDKLAIDRVVLFGTSLGGLVSTIIARQHGSRVAAAILNDIGPEIGEAGLARIKSYIGRLPPVADWDEAVAQAKEVYGLAWRDLSDDEWLRLAKRGYCEDDDGVPRLDLDPNIGEAARTVGTELEDPWVLFSGLRDKPAMVIHGELSDILTDAIVARMIERKPDLIHVKVANRGHVPLLDEPECLDAIDTFLKQVNDDA